MFRLDNLNWQLFSFEHEPTFSDRAFQFGEASWRKFKIAVPFWRANSFEKYSQDSSRTANRQQSCAS